MASKKNKRQRKITVYCAIEGEKREATFLEHLKKNYSKIDKMNFPDNPRKGGNPDFILNSAFKNLHNYDRVFAWIDEDLQIALETRQSLMRFWNVSETDTDKFLAAPLKELQHIFNKNFRKPVLIVSNPISIEGMLIKILGHVPPHINTDQDIRKKQIKELKNMFDGILNKRSEAEFYQECLTKDVLEEARKTVFELDILINQISI